MRRAAALPHALFCPHLLRAATRPAITPTSGATCWQRTANAGFNTHGGLQRANGDFLRAKVLSRGFSADPITLFKEFYGQAPDVQPLLEFRGLTATRKAP